MTTFSAQIEAFARKIPGALDDIRKGAAQDIVEEMQTPKGAGGNMRVRTGFLWNSLMGSTAAMPTINPGSRPPKDATPGSYGYDGAQIELVILGSELTDPLFFGYTAAYAGVREYHDGFVRLAAQNWRDTVFRNTAKVKAARGL